MTVPTVGRIDPHGGESDLARWAPRGVERLLDSAGIVGEVRGYGNVLSCVAALWGLAVEDLSSEELDVVDDRFPLGVLVRSVKPALLVPEGEDRSSQGEGCGPQDRALPPGFYRVTGRRTLAHLNLTG